MTALKQFERLESPGVWREHDAAQRRDVIVAFGDASLVINDTNLQALTHWSLAAIDRLNPGEMPALYTPDRDSSETLEVEDDLMVDAIETVRGAIARARPRNGRLRLVVLAASVIAIGGLGVFWLPDALVRHAASVVPEQTRAKLGSTLLSHLSRVSGAPCRAQTGTQALAQLSQNLPGAGQTVVLPSGIKNAAHLPGGLVLLNRSAVEDHDSPDVAAGFILAERMRAAQDDPLEHLLHSAGLGATFRLLTTGGLPQQVLVDYAQALPMRPPTPIPDEQLLAMFQKAGLASSPYAYALDVSGETTLGLIEADPMQGTNTAPILTDEDWVRLQGICGG